MLPKQTIPANNNRQVYTNFLVNVLPLLSENFIQTIAAKISPHGICNTIINPLVASHCNSWFNMRTRQLILLLLRKGQAERTCSIDSELSWDRTHKDCCNTLHFTKQSWVEMFQGWSMNYCMPWTSSLTVPEKLIPTTRLIVWIHCKKATSNIRLFTNMHFSTTSQSMVANYLQEAGTIGYLQLDQRPLPVYLCQNFLLA